MGGDVRPEVPDVLCLDMNEAIQLLSEAGYTFRLVETRAPRRSPRTNRFRVVRVRADDAPRRLELVVCAM